MVDSPSPQSIVRSQKSLVQRPESNVQRLFSMPIALFIFLPLVFGFVVVGVYLERKVSAFIQDRMGPMEVGKWGLLQLIADLLKLIQKEDIVPLAADKRIFLAAPVVIFTAIFAGYAVLPLAPNVLGSSAEVGIFFLLTVISIDVIGLLMAGWGSNNKYALFGAMRAIGQIISYEIPLGLSVLCVIMICQSLNLQEISYQQGTFSAEPIYLLGYFDTQFLNTEKIDWFDRKSPLLIANFL